MKKIDFSNYKFRASGIRYLMVNSRKKSDPLSQTTKSYLRELWIEAVFGRRKPVITPAMQKGTIVESDSMELVQKVYNQIYFKNNKQLENDFITGTPDIIDKAGGSIKDIKSSWDLWSFAKVDQKSARKDYYYQVLSYMWLSDIKKSELIYALVNTPEIFINDEIYKLSFKMPEEEAEKYRVNFTYDDIDDELKIKRYEFLYSEDDVDLLKNKIVLCRDHMNGLSL